MRVASRHRSNVAALRGYQRLPVFFDAIRALAAGRGDGESSTAVPQYVERVLLGHLPHQTGACRPQRCGSREDSLVQRPILSCPLRSVTILKVFSMFTFRYFSGLAALGRGYGGAEFGFYHPCRFRAKSELIAAVNDWMRF